MADPKITERALEASERAETMRHVAQNVEIVAQYAEEMADRAPNDDARTAYRWIAEAVRQGRHVEWAQDRYLEDLRVALDKQEAERNG